LAGRWREGVGGGYTVVGTVKRRCAARVRALSPQAAVGRVLDVTDFDASTASSRIEASVGPIDVLVNNAGYGHEGVMEESPLAELRRQFDVNVFGAVAMMKAVVPFMRARRRGHILNITSMGGHITMPGIAYYCGSKFARRHLRSARQGTRAVRHRGDGRRTGSFTATGPAAR
jgi:short-subunit dehydrogenase